MSTDMEIVFRERALGMVIGCRAADQRAARSPASVRSARRVVWWVLSKRPHSLGSWQVVVTVKAGGAAEAGGATPGLLIRSVNGSTMTDFDTARVPCARVVCPGPLSLGTPT